MKNNVRVEQAVKMKTKLKDTDDMNTLAIMQSSCSA
jgi:hypothetical protein